MADTGQALRALGAPDVVARKGSGTPLVMVTAYDAPSARAVDAAGVDMILVGDSVAMVVLGYDDTLQVTIDDMVHHVGAVARTRPRALVVGDLPWLSYHVSRDETVRNAASLSANDRSTTLSPAHQERPRHDAQVVQERGNQPAFRCRLQLPAAGESR